MHLGQMCKLLIVLRLSADETGLCIHRKLPQAFPYHSGYNYAGGYLYDIDDGELLTTGFRQIGTAGESDAVLDAAITADRVAGEPGSRQHACRKSS